MGETRDKTAVYRVDDGRACGYPYKGKETNMYAPMLLKASVLAVTFALSIAPVWAQQKAGVKGSCLGLDTITTTTFDPMASVSITVPAIGADNLWHCAVTCSIQTDNPVASSKGELALTINGTLEATTERDFEHTANADNDLDFQEVSTTKYIPFTTGNNFTLACAARKLTVGSADFGVKRSCITAVCTDESL
jgi:hypothetical protein